MGYPPPGPSPMGYPPPSVAPPPPSVEPPPPSVEPPPPSGAPPPALECCSTWCPSNKDLSTEYCDFCCDNNFPASCDCDRGAYEGDDLCDTSGSCLNSPPPPPPPSLPPSTPSSAGDDPTFIGADGLPYEVRGGLRAGVCEVAERADASSRAGRARVASRRRGLRPKPWPRRVFRLD